MSKGYKNMDYQKSEDIGGINRDLSISIHDKIMAANKYPTLTKDEKEQAIFDNLIGYVEFQEKGYDILSYLIIGYKISPENSINRLGGYISKTVNTLFMARRFDEDLNMNLELNPKKKVLKI